MQQGLLSLRFDLRENARTSSLPRNDGDRRSVAGLSCALSEFRQQAISADLPVNLSSRPQPPHGIRAFIYFNWRVELRGRSMDDAIGPDSCVVVVSWRHGCDCAAASPLQSQSGSQRDELSRRKTPNKQQQQQRGRKTASISSGDRSSGDRDIVSDNDCDSSSSWTAEETRLELALRDGGAVFRELGSAWGRHEM